MEPSVQPVDSDAVFRYSVRIVLHCRTSIWVQRIAYWWYEGESLSLSLSLTHTLLLLNEDDLVESKPTPNYKHDVKLCYFKP